ncbi:MAG: class I tRNA ligase family protein, partial [Bacteroidales bacterium]|nr:class I tRNA ligase family protein [Bacteroidales bacterium]
LWPISVFDPQMPGHPDHLPNKDLSYYYPTSDLVTGPDIIFFWVARMIMAGEEFMGKEPFSNVYFTGIVRDKIGRKMSKTLGNSPDPLDLIAKYGADAVRIGMLLCASAGNDIFYDESQVEQGRNFCNKIWNSFRLIQGWKVDERIPQPEAAATAVEWFGNKLAQVTSQVEDHYAKFRISDALMAIYKTFWDDYCSWYLEAVKPAWGEAADAKTYRATLQYFETLLKMIHPVMPFITEELWHAMQERGPQETIMYQPSPRPAPFDEDLLTRFEIAQETVNAVRAIRQQKNIEPKEPLALLVKADFPAGVAAVICKLANVGRVSVADDFGGKGTGVSQMIRTFETFVPLGNLVNVDEEIAKLSAELERQQGFLASVRKKLANEAFVAHAPEKIVALERKKESDSLSKIESLEQAIIALKNNA